MPMAKRTLRTLVITSKVTFAPGNYDPVIIGLAACPQVAGLLILDNKNWSTFAKSIGALAHGAYRLGGTLMTNQFWHSQQHRLHAYAAQRKPVWTLKRLNSPEALKIIHAYRFDLLLNARTRVFFGKDLLEAPALGAINIHHGLLPAQRGTMCDLWSLFNAEPCGFSVHKMNSEIDSGDILKVVTVSDGTDTDYIKYLRKSAPAELQAVCEILGDIESTGEINGRPNVQPIDLPARKDPARRDIKIIKRGELLI